MDVQSDMFMMSKTVSMASGFLNMTGSIDSEINKNCDSIWPAELNSKFTGKYVVGSGATACVFLAHDDTNTLVAVKVGKTSSGKDKAARFASWKAECDDMQAMRLKGCRAGKEILKMHEQYLPTCTMVAEHKNGAYYVMHAAGETPIEDAVDLSKQDAASVFSALVASIYALHAVDLTHNDLHGSNIVLDKTQLALIDFGSLKTLEKSWKKDYKRDSNAIWRWGAVLAGCEAGAQWPNPPTSGAAKRFLTCMRDFSNEEPTFMAALKKVVDGNVAESTDHYVAELYNSEFIQRNKPEPKTYYPWSGSDGCLSWDSQKWARYDFEQQFSGFVKCDTVPSHKTVTRKEKKGKVRVKETIQCPGGTHQTACWSMQTGQAWACGGCSNGVVNKGQDGGCLFESHPSYQYAGEYGQ